MLNALKMDGAGTGSVPRDAVVQDSVRRSARNEADLLANHSALVRRIAWHVHSRMSTAIEVEDLIQIGMIALIEAAQNFEDRGIPFIPYASMRIRGAMIDALRRDARMCRSGMGKRRELAKAYEKLEHLLMRAPTEAEMAEAMNLDIGRYRAMQATTQAVRQDSIDELYNDQDLWFADLADRADEVLEKSQMRSLLGQNLSRLTEREQMVLSLYFIEEMNLEEIGLTLDVGAARICQIKNAALVKLRAMMVD